MTRIIAGRAGGRRLSTPPGTATRPTSDRVREALFSAIESWCGSLSGLRVLDLYAGSGAVGLEAWSRGAAAVTLVESDRRTAALVAANARDLGAGEAQVLTSAVATVLARPPAGEPYDVVFADPPYPLSDEAVAADLRALVEHHWLAPDALVVVERSVRSPEPVWPAGLEPHRRRAYGETVLWYGHAALPAPDEDQPRNQPSTPIEGE
ncbi:16S rRNA (guanine(966)-N(2))-methyltransferase RsmD [Nocardioides ochotonae]|uniref:16S rRNA (guanine(966)-N(2))-methyltransferase RsmD n=1 Tax=Nocardioides ochotonae TaxID=2685869 RepID=UPI001408D72C|nr:16S rRNA (guanine(966)-N(2))-methyltransferase RsmD [Nocardioides ochotonae]